MSAPEWGDATAVRQHFGIAYHHLNEAAKTGEVKRRYINTKCLFEFESIREWLDSLPDDPNYDPKTA